MNWRDGFQSLVVLQQLGRYQAHPVRNWSARPAGAVIDAIVLHDTATLSVPSVLQTFSDPREQRSAHYLIDRAGMILALVPVEHKAWHAGQSTLWGAPDLNASSVGIELVDTDDRTGVVYTDEQLQSLLALTVELIETQPTILLNRIVGHAHIAMPPGRKGDPGPDFPWRPYLEAVGYHVLRRRTLT